MRYRTGTRAASGLQLIVYLAILLAAPVADGLVHEVRAPHDVAHHLHGPADDGCPPPHPLDCHFCQLARSQLGSATAAARTLSTDVAARRPPPPAAPALAPFTGPLGARAPPAA